MSSSVYMKFQNTLVALCGIGFMLVLCTACSSELPHPTLQPTQQTYIKTITLAIQGDDQVGTILPSTSIQMSGEFTVLDVLLEAARLHQLSIDYTGSGMTAYIQGIAGLQEYDRGAKSGWQFRVNDELALEGAGSYVLNDQDKIEWFYTLDFTADLEAK